MKRQLVASAALKLRLKKVNAPEILFRNYFERVCEGVTKVDCGEPKKVKADKPYVFYDQNKNKVVMWGNMMTFTKNKALPQRCTKPCKWCKNKFTTQPIGLPIAYEPENREPKMVEAFVAYLKGANLVLDDGTDHFITEGLFCDDPCMFAYCLDKISSTGLPKYKKALNLIPLLQIKLYGHIKDIVPADHWETLIDYGGSQTITEFRAKNKPTQLTETVNVKRPFMYSSSTYYQEKPIKI